MKHFDVMVTVTLRKNVGPPMPKQNGDSDIRKPRTVGNMHFFVSCQIDFVN